MTNSPSLEVIASPVANFILLHKRKHFKQLAKPKKGAKEQDLHISSLGGHFYMVPYEHFLSGCKGAKRPHVGDSPGSCRSLIKFV